MPAAVPLPRDTALSEEARRTLASLPPLNVFRMMANAPASLQPFLELAGSIRATTSTSSEGSTSA